MPVFLEVIRQVQDRLDQNLALTEHEGDEQAPNAAIAVEKWVQRLEVGVRNAYLEKRW